MYHDFGLQFTKLLVINEHEQRMTNEREDKVVVVLSTLLCLSTVKYGISNVMIYIQLNC